MTDFSWYVVRNTPGVTGFVGAGAKPVPLHDYEAEQILEQMGYNESRYKMEYEVGQNVRVIDGPFENFIGIINEVSLDRGKMKVTISMFGRETPVELDFSQVEKV